MSVIERWETNNRQGNVGGTGYSYRNFAIAWPLIFLALFFLMRDYSETTEIAVIMSLMYSGAIAATLIRRKRNKRYAVLKNQRKKYFSSNKPSPVVELDKGLVQRNSETLQQKAEANLELLAQVTNPEVKDTMVDLYERLLWTAKREADLKDHAKQRMLATSIADEYLPITATAFVELEDQQDSRASAYIGTILDALGKELSELNRAIDTNQLENLQTNNNALAALFASFDNRSPAHSSMPHIPKAI